MSSKIKHNKQVNSNVKLLNESLFVDKDCEYNDWVVTIIFYTAVHIIERYLSQHGIHTKNHDERNRIISRTRELNSIVAEYNLIKNASVNSRYCCKRFSCKDVQELKESLNKISHAIDSQAEAI